MPGAHACMAPPHGEACSNKRSGCKRNGFCSKAAPPRTTTSKSCCTAALGRGCLTSRMTSECGMLSQLHSLSQAASARSRFAIARPPGVVCTPCVVHWSCVSVCKRWLSGMCAKASETWHNEGMLGPAYLQKIIQCHCSHLDTVGRACCAGCARTVAWWQASRSVHVGRSGMAAGCARMAASSSLEHVLMAVAMKAEDACVAELCLVRWHSKPACLRHSVMLIARLCPPKYTVAWNSLQSGQDVCLSKLVLIHCLPGDASRDKTAIWDFGGHQSALEQWRP